jgi:hypothetical protein
MISTKELARNIISIVFLVTNHNEMGRKGKKQLWISPQRCGSKENYSSDERITADHTPRRIKVESRKSRQRDSEAKEAFAARWT